ncbi:ATP-dependent clpX-like chaperone, mitochondrial [Monosporozyma unispora]|nr:ATP-binding protein [Kazachstania unispora]
MLFLRCNILIRAYSVGASSMATRHLVNSRLPKIPSPRALKGFLDEYIIGQDTGKKVLSVAVYNHYLRINDKLAKEELAKEREALELNARTEEERRVRELQDANDKKDKYDFDEELVPRSEAEAGLKNIQRQLKDIKLPQKNALKDDDEDLQLSKSNVLVVGPSGSGKTLLATTLAKVLDVPIAISDCTQLTQAGYIGEDVEVCIERLLVNANFDVAKAERGIIVLDEIDKLAKPAASIGTKDVSGEGVQQSLLKIIEGHKVEVVVKRPVKESIDDKSNKQTVKKDESFVIDTSNILFMIMGAFVGLDKHVAKRIKKLKNQNKEEPESSAEKKKEDDDIKNLRFSNTIEEIELPNGKRVSALNLATPTDLVSFGLIPELVGRVPIITALEPLQRDDLYHILKEPKNALLDQYEYIFKQFGVRLCVTEKALKKVAQFALKEGTGARGLRGIMERILLNVNYDCPESGIQYVLVTESTVDSLQQTEYSLASHVDAKYYSRGQRDDLIKDVYEEDKNLGMILDKEFGRTPTIRKNANSKK